MKANQKVISVSEAARQLGVTRTHLSLVIHGHRKSASLMKRYRRLVTSAKKRRA